MTDSNAPVALVTGASSGIGRDTALLLAERGYRLALVARREAGLAETADLIREQVSPDAPLLTLPTDVCDPDALGRAVDATLEAYGRIDAVANVAGNAPLLPIDKITPEIWRQCVDANLSSTVLMTARVWPTFRKQKSGVLVNVSSMSSIDPFPGFSIYAAAKIGVNMFTQCAAKEGAKLGIRAVAVAPGAVETPMLRANFSEKVLPRDRTLDPADVAAVIRDCITGDRDFKPGEVIVVESP